MTLVAGESRRYPCPATSDYTRGCRDVQGRLGRRMLCGFFWLSWRLFLAVITSLSRNIAGKFLHESPGASPPSSAQNKSPTTVNCLEIEQIGSKMHIDLSIRIYIACKSRTVLRIDLCTGESLPLPLEVVDSILGALLSPLHVNDVLIPVLTWTTSKCWRMIA